MWNNVDDKLPGAGETFDLLLADVLVYGKYGMYVGFYAYQYQVEMEDGEFLEDTGNYYLPSGWYRYCDLDDKYVRLEGVTHWAELPDVPCSKTEQQP